ncbi:MAG TPA: hypothetical protein VIK83_00560 [Coriobacteriia bacterium]
MSRTLCHEEGPSLPHHRRPARAGRRSDGERGGPGRLQTSDFQASATKSYGPWTTALLGSWYSLDLTGGAAYINKSSAHSGLTQIRLRFKLDDNNNRKSNYLSLYSGNASTSLRPQLVVTYYTP